MEANFAAIGSMGAFIPGFHSEPIILRYLAQVISFIGSLFLFSSIVIFLSAEDLEQKIEKHWKKYSVNSDSEIADIEQEYLGQDEPEIKTAAQGWAERHAKSGRELINDKNLNKRKTYTEQFYEGHAAQGGRIIEVSSHIVRDKKDIKKLIGETNKGLNYLEGRLIHFGQPVNGIYLWIVDEDGNFIIANRTTFHHEMPQMNKNKIDYQHRLHKLPHATLARDNKIFGSGEVLIEGGLIKEYNTASGHYIDLRDVEKFNDQGKEVFEYFSKKTGWKEVKEGAKYKTKK